MEDEIIKAIVLKNLESNMILRNLKFEEVVNKFVFPERKQRSKRLINIIFYVPRFEQFKIMIELFSVEVLNVILCEQSHQNFLLLSVKVLSVVLNLFDELKIKFYAL